MSKIVYVAYTVIILCLIIWAIGVFLYGMGLAIHLLLVIAVIIAILAVLKKIK